MGEGVAFGKTDDNIAKGLSCEKAVGWLLKAMFLERHQIVLGSLYYLVLPKIAAISETANFFFCRLNLKQQV